LYDLKAALRSVNSRPSESEATALHTPGLCTDARLQPLAPGIDQGDQHHGHVESGRGEPGDLVEALFGRGVEDQQRVQRRQSPGFVVGKGATCIDAGRWGRWQSNRE